MSAMSRGWVVMVLCLVGCGSSTVSTESATPTVAEPPVAPTPAMEPAAPVEEPADPVAAACSALAEAAETTLSLDLDRVRPADVELAEDIWDGLAAPFGECLDAGEGAWVVEPLSLRLLADRRGTEAAVDAPAQSMVIEYVLTYVDSEGEAHRRSEAAELFHEISDQIPEGQRLRTFAPQDVDGDGIGELAIVVASFGPDYGETEDAILRFRDGDVGPFDDFGEMRLRDMDEDGRFDVLVQRPWSCRFSNDMEGTTYEAGCPWVVMHGTDDGFSIDDSVAEAYLRERCPRRPTALITEDPDGYCWPTRGEDALRVACARLWGASAAEVQARVRREYRQRVSRTCRSDEDLAMLLAHAEHEPPLTLE